MRHESLTQVSQTYNFKNLFKLNFYQTNSQNQRPTNLNNMYLEDNSIIFIHKRIFSVFPCNPTLENNYFQGEAFLKQLLDACDIRTKHFWKVGRISFYKQKQNTRSFLLRKYRLKIGRGINFQDKLFPTFQTTFWGSFTILNTLSASNICDVVFLFLCCRNRKNAS